MHVRGYKAFENVTNRRAIGCGTNGFHLGKGWNAIGGSGIPYFPDIVEDLINGRIYRKIT